MHDVPEDQDEDYSLSSVDIYGILSLVAYVHELRHFASLIVHDYYHSLPAGGKVCRLAGRTCLIVSESLAVPAHLGSFSHNLLAPVPHLPVGLPKPRVPFIVWVVCTGIKNN